jgi:hypothetical protein
MSLVTLTNTGKATSNTQTRQMADIIFDLPSGSSFFITQPASAGEYVDEEEVVGTYLTEGNFAFTFEKRGEALWLIRDGRNDVELEREADNIFQQKFDPAFKQEFTVDEFETLKVTAYYTSHSPYTLTKVQPIEETFDFTSLNGLYVNAETNTTIAVNYSEEKNYNITYRDNKQTTGLLVSETKMLVNSLSLVFKGNELYLSGKRIRQVKYIRK